MRRLAFPAALLALACVLGGTRAERGLPLSLGCEGRVVSRPASSAGPAATAPAPTATASAPAPATDVAASRSAAPPAPFASARRFGVWIRGGDVIDGTGAPRRRADVLVAGDSISYVGAVAPGVRADRLIDATGKVVTPGFIDAHAHTDAAARRSSDPLGEVAGFLAMGVTTICLGQDGRSPSDEGVEHWLAEVGGRPLGLNALAFAGHGTIRSQAGVGLSTHPGADQIRRMVRLVERELGAGAFGLTTGLEYRPGRLAALEELVAVAKPVAARNALVMSHLRSEDDDAIEPALDELLAQGERSGARVHVSHLKVVSGKGAARAEQILGQLQAARARGVRVTADIYPYDASYTNLGILFPDFALPPNDLERAKATRGEELRAFLRRRIVLRGGPEAVLFGSAPYRGKTLAELAAELQMPFEDVLVHIGPHGARAAYFVMDDALQSRLLADAHVTIGSDGSARTPHPRSYGTFARVIRRDVLERKLFSLEEAVRKMTGFAAQTVGLDRQRRGLVAAGWAADLLVFDPAKVRDVADYPEPARLAEGFDWVLVNGRLAREDGKPTAVRAGRVLRRQDTATPLAGPAAP
ncbi:MAG: amidohydrolase family protein [Deltaproteobacteria bacterium]|nr:amidohydrolase family protein [Deltaproteobacteria bacterium]